MAQIEKKIEFEEEYELVTVHTTFDLTSGQLRYISMIDGVSSLQEFTRYKYLLRVGKLFDVNAAKEEITKFLIG